MALLEVKNLHTYFKTRKGTVKAVNDVSYSIEPGKTLGIVGESGSGKSVSAMSILRLLDANGYIDEGSIIFNDDELAATSVSLTATAQRKIVSAIKKLNKFSKLELGAATYRAMEALKAEKAERESLSEEETKSLTDTISDLEYQCTELFNQRQTVDRKTEKERYKQMSIEINAMNAKIKELRQQEKQAVENHKQAARNDAEYNASYAQKMEQLKQQYEEQINGTISEEAQARNVIIAKEIYLSVGRYGFVKRMQNGR